MFCVYLKIICVLLLLDGVSCEWKFGQIDSLIPVLWILPDFLSSSENYWETSWSLHLSLLDCQFPLQISIHAFGTVLLKVYACVIITSSWCINSFVVTRCFPPAFLLWKSISSDVRRVAPAALGLLYACYLFFHPLNFSLFVSLNLRFVFESFH